MTHFLQLVAQSLRQLMHDDLSRTTVIFPNKRAGLFLDDFLADEHKPIWSPRYMTISEFFTSLTSVQIADPIDTVCRLYQHYVRLTGSNESLDFFYGWGERLLADFDDLDKNLGEPSLIFRDLKDYGEIDNEEFLTAEQVEQLKRFVGDFSADERSVVRERFLRLWNAMLPLYEALRADLSNDNLAYEGQLYRQVVEDLETGKVALPTDTDHIVFVGFNVLDAAEKKLFQFLMDKGKALFYWDYDTYFTEPLNGETAEAGVFLKENLKLFPNALSEDVEFGNFLKERNNPNKRSLVFAEANTEAIQAHYVTQWLNDSRNYQADKAKRSAVVLCNENLLQPVLHSLPPNLTVNITKGFPLNHTPAYSALVRETEQILQEHDAKALREGNGGTAATASPDELRQVLQRLQLLIADQARPTAPAPEQEEWLQTLYTESYFQTYTLLARFIQLVDGGRLIVNLQTLFRLIRNVLRTQSVPFHGEPAIGLQVMGVLETRCLNFDNVLMLSVNEGTLPQRATDASFIPFLIRKRYGLTTYLHKTSVYAYYFFRLLSRAERVTLTYNNSATGINRSEMSRFMKSLLIDDRVLPYIEHTQLYATPRPDPFIPHIEAHNPIGDKPFKASFSPTAVNCYLECHRKFYFKYIRHFETPQSAEGIIDPRDFGKVFHKAAENIFRKYISSGRSAVSAAQLARFLKEKGKVVLENEVRLAFKEENVARTLIVEAAIKEYLKELLEYEAGQKTAPIPADAFTFRDAERRVSTTLRVPFGGEGALTPIEIFGDIDRIDQATLPNGLDCLRIIDYKTGGNPVKVKNMEALFACHKKDLPHYPFQTFMYSLMVLDSVPFPTAHQLPLLPALYFIPRMNEDNFSPYLTFAEQTLYDFRPYAEDFRSRLTHLLAEIISPDNTFDCTNQKAPCKYCDFKALCGRGE